VDTKETATSAPVTLDEGDIELPDILTDLQDKTQLTRRSIHRILVESGRLDDFKRNPQQFIELAAEIINRAKRLALVDGIKYQRIGDEAYYAQELFETEELSGYLKNDDRRNKVVHEQVVYQSDTETYLCRAAGEERGDQGLRQAPRLVQGADTRSAPTTPTGPCSSRRTVTRRLYFVVETKSSLFTDDLRDKEGAKIDLGCGKAHQAVLRPGRQFARTGLPLGVATRSTPSGISANLESDSRLAEE
jgi:type III restriction enzyme